MTITGLVVKNIIRKLLAGEDYRIEVVNLIDAEFLQYIVEFFTKVFQAKLKNKNITIDWYRQELLDTNLPKTDIAINSGLNMKTISNMFNTGTKEVVIDAAIEHYDSLYAIIDELTKIEDLDVELTIKFGKASVTLNINESLIVINTIAVKRAALRGGLWSTAGKQVEKPLCITLCKIFQVPEEFYPLENLPNSLREVDFYFLKDGEHIRSEVKLMGKGNPESADAVIARASRVFIADKLSETNKRQLNERNVLWVELRAENGFQRFSAVLDALKIPYTPFEGNLNVATEAALSHISDEEIPELEEVTDDGEKEEEEKF
jgi:hypothetical protein